VRCRPGSSEWQAAHCLKATAPRAGSPEGEAVSAARERSKTAKKMTKEWKNIVLLLAGPRAIRSRSIASFDIVDLLVLPDHFLFLFL
jgi:hypothetical protein